MAFSWIDTRDVRPSESRAYAILNDSERVVSAAVLDAMRSYEVNPILWSEREKALPELAA